MAPATFPVINQLHPHPTSPTGVQDTVLQGRGRAGVTFELCSWSGPVSLRARSGSYLPANLPVHIIHIQVLKNPTKPENILPDVIF